MIQYLPQRINPATKTDDRGKTFCLLVKLTAIIPSSRRDTKHQNKITVGAEEAQGKSSVGPKASL